MTYMCLHRAICTQGCQYSKKTEILKCGEAKSRAYALMKAVTSFLTFNFFFHFFFSLSLVFLFSYIAYNIVNVEAGHEAVLTCASTSKLCLVMVTWEIKSNTSCSLAYRNDRNETKLNCSERMMWKYSPDRDPALRIYPVNLSDEGNYTCEIASDMGNFHFSSSLSVIGKTHLVFFCSCWMEIKMT